MKPTIPQAAALSLLSILVLSAAGISYAAWTDQITIHGMATTADLCWEFGSANTLDPFQPTNPGGDYPVPPYLADWTCFPGFAWNEEVHDWMWRLDKNVAWCQTSLVDLDGDGCRESMMLWVNNTYPCNFHEVSYYVRNCGSLPLRINAVQISDGHHVWNVTGIDFLAELDFNDDGAADFELLWNEPLGAQIHPGGHSQEMSFWMHTLQPCPQAQLDSLHFTITVQAVQWNEYPYSEPT